MKCQWLHFRFVKMVLYTENLAQKAKQTYGSHVKHSPANQHSDASVIQVQRIQILLLLTRVASTTTDTAAQNAKNSSPLN